MQPVFFCYILSILVPMRLNLNWNGLSLKGETMENQIKSAFPSISSLDTNPQYLESAEKSRLSPIIKYLSGGMIILARLEGNDLLESWMTCECSPVFDW